MKKICTAVMALAFTGISLSPALAGVPSANYLLTITGGRGLPVGGTACVTLQETGNVLGFTNSGTISSGGYTGNYYVFRSVLTAQLGGLFLSGTIYHKGIVNTAIYAFNGDGFTGVGSFSAVLGGC